MEEQTAREEVLQQLADTIDVGELLLTARRRAPAYKLEAFHWVLTEGIEFTLKQHLGLPESQRRHLSGREIVQGLAQLAREQFGPLAREVWAQWGIRQTRDWGEVVYALIAVGLLHKSEQDRIEDFDNVFDINQTL